jgi:hypothetical protein
LVTQVSKCNPFGHTSEKIRLNFSGGISTVSISVNTYMKIKVSYETWNKMHQFLVQNYCTSSDYRINTSNGIVELEFTSHRCFELIEHYWHDQFIMSDRGGDLASDT